VSRTPTLTLWRPWTSCITDIPGPAAKRVENRGWTTGYRGDIWLHAGKKFDADNANFGNGIWAKSDPCHEVGSVRIHYATDEPILSTNPADHPTGVVALVELVGICTETLSESGFYGGPDCDCGPWSFPGEAHWRIANVRRLAEPVPCRGAQQLWTLPADVEAACRVQLEAVAR
jgi:hypothetical protein